MAEPALFPEGGFRRLRFDIAYDGTAFSGWATQPGMRTMQDMVEEAIARIVRHDVDSVVAGRTDAGVHATGQVIHVDVADAAFDRELTYKDLRYKLNRLLDEDIRITEITDAPSGFHARFSAFAANTPTRFSMIIKSSLQPNALIPPLGIATLMRR